MKRISNQIFVHWTPHDNKNSIMSRGLLLPSNIDSLDVVSPYDAYKVSRRFKDSGFLTIKEKSKYTYFGRVDICKTLNEWVKDETFLKNNIGFHYDGEFYDKVNYRDDRNRMFRDIPINELKVCILTTEYDDIELLLKTHDLVIHYDTDSNERIVYSN